MWGDVRFIFLLILGTAFFGLSISFMRGAAWARWVMAVTLILAVPVLGFAALLWFGFYGFFPGLLPTTGACIAGYTVFFVRRSLKRQDAIEKYKVWKQEQPSPAEDNRYDT